MLDRRDVETAVAPGDADHDPALGIGRVLQADGSGDATWNRPSTAIN